VIIGGIVLLLIVTVLGLFLCGRKNDSDLGQVSADTLAQINADAEQHSI